jgi:hypothetical protein
VPNSTIMRTLVLKTVSHNFKVLAFVLNRCYHHVARVLPVVVMIFTALAMLIAPTLILMAIIMLKPVGAMLALLLLLLFTSCSACVFMLDYVQRR